MSLAAAVAGALVLFAAGHRYGVKKNYSRAEAAWEAGDYRRAIDLYQTVVDDYPSDPLAGQAAYRAGSTYYLFLGKERKAVLAFRELIRKAPGSSWGIKAQGELGYIFEHRLEDYRQAIVEYERVLGIASSPAEKEEAQLSVARCYFKMGDYLQAREEYEVFLEQFPESGLTNRALTGVASCYYVNRLYQSAIKYYRMAYRESGDDQLKAEAGFGIAVSLEEAGELAAALRQFEEILEFHPNAPLVHQRIERLKNKAGVLK